MLKVTIVKNELLSSVLAVKEQKEQWFASRFVTMDEARVPSTCQKLNSNESNRWKPSGSLYHLLEKSWLKLGRRRKITAFPPYPRIIGFHCSLKRLKKVICRLGRTLLNLDLSKSKTKDFRAQPRARKKYKISANESNTRNTQLFAPEHLQSWNC